MAKAGRPNWTTAADIRNQLLQLWNSGKILSTSLFSEPLFPLKLRFRPPTSQALADEFDAVRSWIRALDEGSRTHQGFGYDIVWRHFNHRQLGNNTVPESIIVSSEVDAVRLIGKSADAETFSTLSHRTLTEFPVLHEWLSRKPLTLLRHQTDWERILGVLAWFAEHPQPNLYIRSLEIPGIDSKFIETHRGILAELLDLTLPAHHIDQGTKDFERRYGLRSKPVTVRFRLLDHTQSLASFTDISVPAEQLAKYEPQVHTVFITENEINGLAFPPCAGAMVIFGLGKGLERLLHIPWLQEKTVYYWGDLDTYGFEILDSLRARLSHAKSFLMDSETLLMHRSLWVHERQQFTGKLERLTPSELAVFEALRDNVYGQAVRLEQERISFTRLKAWLTSIGIS
ncbi:MULTISPECIES: DUF3322 domain-containing protein [Kordiimonas]|jgi:hypothetical protein|uniref:DUF3322 domain-containing protein n=1 Tax=Kordiimonas TaxID=288021 RepID=UPI00257E7840|nr:DUF3322 domain-containing protein [Kordiimonas sp. UBA4487]